MRLMIVLCLLMLPACAGYKSNSGDREMGFGPATASGGVYQRDGFYDGGDSDPDVTIPRPGESF